VQFKNSDSFCLWASGNFNFKEDLFAANTCNCRKSGPGKVSARSVEKFSDLDGFGLNRQRPGAADVYRLNADWVF